MDTNEAKAVLYRHRAKETMALAALTNDDKVRDSITLVAANYVSMAEEMEGLGRFVKFKL